MRNERIKDNDNKYGLWHEIHAGIPKGRACIRSRYRGKRALVYEEMGTYPRDIWHANGGHTVVQSEIKKIYRVLVFFLDDDGKIINTADCNSNGCGREAAWEGVIRAFKNPKIRNIDFNPKQELGFVKGYQPLHKE